ncbi:MAG: hypothetical protein AAB416_02520 [Patescibacteria group bacterium]
MDDTKKDCSCNMSDEKKDGGCCGQQCCRDEKEEGTCCMNKEGESSCCETHDDADESESE